MQLLPILLQKQFLNAAGVKHVAHGQVAKHDEDGIVRVFAMLGGAPPIFGRESS
jgi:hypothetical protein